jgi:hypothetical protein
MVGAHGHAALRPTLLDLRDVGVGLALLVGTSGNAGTGSRPPTAGLTDYGGSLRVRPLDEFLLWLED